MSVRGQIPLRRECGLIPEEGSSMWASAPQTLASSPDAGPAKSASQILF